MDKLYFQNFLLRIFYSLPLLYFITFYFYDPTFNFQDLMALFHIELFLFWFCVIVW